VVGADGFRIQEKNSNTFKTISKNFKKGRKSAYQCVAGRTPARKKAIPVEPGMAFSMHNNKIITNPAGKRRSVAQRS
jgi:hypothetical protein